MRLAAYSLIAFYGLLCPLSPVLAWMFEGFGVDENAGCLVAVYKYFRRTEGSGVLGAFLTALFYAAYASLAFIVRRPFRRASAPPFPLQKHSATPDAAPLSKCRFSTYTQCTYTATDACWTCTAASLL